MKYVFEWYKDPTKGALAGNILREETLDLPSDEAAIQGAKVANADYVWSAPEDQNPNEIYKKGS